MMEWQVWFGQLWRDGSQQLLYYQNQIVLMFTSSKSSIMGLTNPPAQPHKQQLMVQINIGKKGERKCIRLCDINNMSYVDQQIKWFIKNNALKDSAFAFIRQLILKQITIKKQEIYNHCHNKCPQGCKCHQRMDHYQEKQKHIFDAIACSDPSRRSISKSPTANSKQPQHLQIKINSKVDNLSTNARMDRIQDISSFVFNSSFTLPSSVGQKQRFFLTDELFENVLETTENRSSGFFSNMSEFKSRQRQKENKIAVKSKQINIKKLSEKSIKPLQSSFKKNSIIINTPSKTKQKLNEQKKSKAVAPTISKQNKLISTKDRKAMLMTPQRAKQNVDQMRNLMVLNSDNLETMAMEHTKNIKQSRQRQEEACRAQPHVQTTHTIEHVLQSLFKKLTANNPSDMKELHSQYVSYQLLEREELHFMGVLFQKIDHKELNHLNFTNFKASSLKYCWKELEQLVFNSQTNSLVEHSRRAYQ